MKRRTQPIKLTISPDFPIIVFSYCFLWYFKRFVLYQFYLIATTPCISFEPPKPHSLRLERMDLRHLPEGYFSVNDSWAGERKPRRYSSHSGSSKRSRRSYRNMPLLILLVVVISILILISFIVILCVVLTSGDPEGPVVSCPEGFSAPDCYRSDFKGHMFWKSSVPYSVNGVDNYYYGVAFRMYAPRATGVSVTIKSGYDRYDRIMMYEVFPLCHS